MNRDDILAALEDLLPQLRDVESDVPLYEGGHIDSYDYVTLTEMLESRYGIQLEASGAIDRIFRTKNSIAQFVDENRQSTGKAAS